MKPKATSRQSMTQWLFKKDFCSCPKGMAEPQEPVRVALSSNSLAALAPTKINKFWVGGIFTLVALAAVTAAIFVLDLPGAIDAVTVHELKEDNDRVLIYAMQADRPLGSMSFDDSALTVITNKGYAHLGLKDSKISDLEMTDMSKIPNLCSVALNNCAFPDAGLEHLAVKPNLTSLSLANTRLTQANLNSLQAGNIETLDLSNTKIDYVDWACLAKLRYLRTLKVTGVRIHQANKRDLMFAGFVETNGIFHRALPVRDRPLP